jgi:hypothetical protein
MAERRRFRISGDQPLMQLVEAASCGLEAVTLLEAVGFYKFIVATRVKSSDRAANLVLLNLNISGMNTFNRLLLVGVLPEFM